MKKTLAYLVAACALLLVQPAAAQEYFRSNSNLTAPVFTGQMTGPTSTCPAPSYSATGQTGTGMAITSTPSVAIAVSGNCIVTATATAVASAVPFNADEYNFATEPTSGFRYGGAGILNFFRVGAVAARIDNANNFGGLSLALNQALKWGSAINLSDVYMTRLAAGHLMNSDGTNAMRQSWMYTFTSLTNYSGFSIDGQTTGNMMTVGTRTAATGTGIPLSLVGQASNAGSVTAMQLQRNSTPWVKVGNQDTLGTFGGGTSGAGTFYQWVILNSATSGQNNIFAIEPAYNQTSGTAANTDFLINRTQTAVGSGPQLLTDMQVGGASQFSVTNTGLVTAALRFVAPDGNFTSRLLMQSTVVINTSSPTNPVACTTPSLTWATGTVNFQVDVGSTCAGVTTLAVTLPATTNAWTCNAVNVTTSATAKVEMTASTTNSATFTNYTRTTGVALAWADGADVRISCLGG